jgi:hypothetical protein
MEYLHINFEVVHAMHFLDSTSLFTNKLHYLSKKHNHKIATPAYFSTPVPSSGGVLSYVTFKNI